MGKVKAVLVCLSLLLISCSIEESNNSKIDSFEQRFWVEDYVKNLSFPWAIAWLPNGDLLLTERLGNIKLIRNGKVISKLEGVPSVMSASPFDGLLDIKVDPDFNTKPYIYLTYTKGSATSKS